MKAKVIETGEIVNVTPYPTWYKEDGQGPDRREWDEDELDFSINSKSKDVDLEKEVEDWVKTGPHTSYPWCTIPDAIRITAEHFYELGLKAQKEEK